MLKSLSNAISAFFATNAQNIAITDNTTSGSIHYPVLVGGTFGNQGAITSSTKQTFKPSTGEYSSKVLSTDYDQSFSGKKVVAATTATNVASSTVVTDATNTTFKVRLNAWVSGTSGSDAYAGESSEWVVNFSTYGGVARTPTVTKISSQAWSESASWITATYTLTVSNVSGTITFTVTQALAGDGIEPINSGICIFEIEAMANAKTTFATL